MYAEILDNTNDFGEHINATSYHKDHGYINQEEKVTESVGGDEDYLEGILGNQNDPKMKTTRK